MRDFAWRALLYCSVILLCVAGMRGHAAAAQCSDVYPGARIGPPPEWTFWGDGSACFVRWPAGGLGDEAKLLERCRSTPGSRFVHFERSKGTGQSICIFKILDMATPATPSTAASEDEEKALAPPESEPDVTAPRELASSHLGPDPDRLAATVGCS